MPVPGVVEADLVMVETDFVLAGLEAFLDAPAVAGDRDQQGERGGLRAVREEEREFGFLVAAPAYQDTYPRLRGRRLLDLVERLRRICDYVTLGAALPGLLDELHVRAAAPADEAASGSPCRPSPRPAAPPR
jgi:hypothetical protein